MRIQKISIKKFKKLEDFQADVNGNNIILVGENGMGKTSVMQFIQIALGGKNIPELTDGRGTVIMDKDGKEHTFKVKIHDGKSTVEISTPDGFVIDKKGALTQFVGSVNFDINHFVELSKTKAGRKEQVEIFKSFLPEDVREQLKGYENKVEFTFTQRTELNRHIKDLEASIKNNALNETDLSKLVPVNVSAEMEELKKIQDLNTRINQVIERRDAREKLIEEKAKKIEELLKQATDLKSEISIEMEKDVLAKQFIKDNKFTDTSAIEEKISTASDHNIKCEKAKKLIEDNKSLTVLKEESEDLTVLIETSRQAITDTIRDLSVGVDGLSFDEETLLYNGYPVSIDTLSYSQIAELGVKMKIAENPDLGLMFLDNLESIGNERFTLIKKIAKEYNFQIISAEVKRGAENLTIELMEE